MTGQQSLQFLEHLRQARHLKSTDAREVSDRGAPDQPQGDLPRNPPPASHVKVREATDLSASEFADEAARVGESVHLPCGCERCGGTGYRGRLGVFEVLELDNELGELIGEKTDGLKIDQAAIRGGMTTMLDDGIAKCRAGLTSPAGNPPRHHRTVR